MCVNFSLYPSYQKVNKPWNKVYNFSILIISTNTIIVSSVIFDIGFKQADIYHS